MKKILEKIKLIPRKTKIIVSIAVAFVIIVGGLCGLVYGEMDKMNYDDGSNASTQEVVLESDTSIEAPEIDEADIVFSGNTNLNGRSEKGIYNILLLGEDHRDDTNYRGLTDVMMVLTINENDNTLKLTSLMRDIYVEIPGFEGSKLNTPYPRGGIQTLYDTITKNFNLHIDGYILVNFSTLEYIIDDMGGVEITLTSEEAEYLNTTNYIYYEQYRNVYAGTQILNGCQAVGYARVRHVGNNDFERTQRQRNIMNAIFTKYKSLSTTEALKVANSNLEYVTTDIDKLEMIKIVTKIVDMNPNELEEFRVPIEGTYEGAYIGDMLALVIDFKENNDELHKFIFGSTENVVERNTSEKGISTEYVMLNNN